ncbi:hypothetical protein ACOSP7_003207 [Xanthoceras sorbifolium]
MGQLATALNERDLGRLPSQVIQNPKGGSRKFGYITRDNRARKSTDLQPAGCSNSGHCDLLARPTACTHNSLKNRTKQLRRARPPDHATNSRRPLSPDEN